MNRPTPPLPPTDPRAVLAAGRAAALIAALTAVGALASVGCVPPAQVAALRDDVNTLRTQVDEMRAAERTRADEVRALRTLLDSTASESRETRADLELRLRSIEERQGASLEQADQTRERIESLSADIAALRSQLTTRGAGSLSGATGTPAPPPLTAPAVPPPSGEAGVIPPAAVTTDSAVAAAERVPEAVQDLFNAAYADYSKARYPLAIKGFEEIVRDYGQTGLADNARYWIGVSRLDGGDAPGAIAEFDRLLRDYPDGDRVAPALLKKGLALIEIKRREAGITELRTLISRFPASDEARVARARLTSLGVAAG